MSTDLPDILAYYARPGALTTLPDSEAVRALLAGLPTAIPDLVRVVQNNLLHIFWAERYGVTLTDEQRGGVQIRTTAARLQRIYDADPAPLTTARAPEKRSVGNCRDFTLTLVTLLRHRGIPARARCGFGAYFLPSHYEDHWVAEYWNADQGRWIMVDAQLDTLQAGVLQLDFDPLDVPHNRFITGGHAWQMVRQQGVDPHLFGIFDMHGPWFIRGDLLRDFAALNRIELLPWDSWGIMLTGDEDMTGEGNALMDRVAALTLAENAGFDDLRALYDSDARLTVPPVIMSFPTGPQPVPITLAAEPGWVDGDPETKAALLDLIAAQRRRLDTLLGSLSDDELLQPDVVGFWSIKDVMAHIVSWEQRYLDWYKSGKRGEPSKHLEPELSQEVVDKMNQDSYEQYRDCTLAEVRALYENSYRETLAAVEAMSEEEIFRVGFYPWTKKWSMLPYLRANTDGHYAEHAEQIEAWRKR